MPMSAHTSYHNATMRSLWLIVAILGNASYAFGDSLIVSFGKSKVQSATGVSSASTLSTSPEPTLSTMEVSSLSGIAGVLSVSVLSHRARLALVQIPDDYNTKKLIRAILKTPGVSYVEPNRPVTAQENELEETYGRRPKDPLYDDNGETSPHEIVGLPYVWQHYTRGRGGVNAPKVCIIDTGIDYTHPDLVENVWINEGEIPGDGIDNDNNGYIDDVYGINTLPDAKDNDPMDDNYHGTHVAGIVGARGNNRLGMAGVAWRTKLIACKFLDSDGSGLIADAVKCIDYCLAVGADMTVNSWGGEDRSQALHDIIDEAQDAGQLFVAAAGNEGRDAETAPIYPGAFEQDIVLSVAATTSNGNDLSWFSNHGAWSVDMAAPGTDILSTMPGGEYGRDSGTSMACPMVAGAAMLLKSYNMDLDAISIKRLLMGWGDELDSMRGFTLSGKRLNVTRAMMHIDEPLPTFPEPPEPELSPTQRFISSAELDELVGSTIVYTYQAGAGENKTGYTVCGDASGIGPSGWLYDPEGGTEAVNLDSFGTMDDDFVEIEFPDEFRFYFYGREQASVFAASNGFLTFGRGDKSYSGSAQEHFGAMRISALFTDLKLDSQTRVSYKMHDGGETFVITYENVPDVNDFGRRQSFQIALLPQGQIKLFYKSLSLDRDVIVGASLGIGIPNKWETKLAGVTCPPSENSYKTYTITVENLSFSQPLSPVLLATHGEGLKLFEFTQPASSEIAEIAENGNPAPLKSALDADLRARFVTLLDSVPPGTAKTATFRVFEGFEHISLASMAMNTNDCFVAINGEQISTPEYAKTQVFELAGLDAGSEENNELCSSIPGPACPQGDEFMNIRHGNGEGFVHVHRGFHGINQFRSELLAPEDLSVQGAPLDAARYDWRNPMARVIIAPAI